MMYRMIGTNNIDVKARNKENIKRLLFKQKSMTKQEIVNALKLSLPTINQNVKELIDENLLDESGTLESSGGRKPQLINFKYEARKSIGLDISQNHIHIVILNLSSDIICEKRINCIFENTKEYWSYLNKLIEDLCLTNEINMSQVLGISITLPGTVIPDKKILKFAPTLQIKNLDLNELEQYFNLPVIFENEANAAGFSEVWNREIINDAIYLSITKGVGGAIIIDNTVFHGKSGCSGEFGHFIIQRDGNRCNCGSSGCFEAYCTVNVLTKDTNGDIDEFFKQVKLGNNAYIKKWDEYLDYLALGLHNIKMIFDLDIIIGGDICDYLQEHVETLKDKMKSLVENDKNIDFVRISRHGKNASAVGGACMIISDFL